MNTTIPSFMKSHQKLLTEEEEINLISGFLASKDPKLFEKIIKSFSPIVIKYARKYTAYGISLDELISVGNHALVEVVYRFNPQLNYRFATYCSSWIRGMMLGFIAANYLSVSIKNQKLKKVFFTLRSILHKEFNQNGRDEITREMFHQLQAHFDLDASEIEQIYHILKQPMISLDEEVSSNSEDQDKTTKGDMLQNNDPNPEDILVSKKIDAYRHTLVHKAITQALNPKERRIILEQMPEDEEDMPTLQTLADELNISRERVRQIRVKAMEKLRKYILSEFTQRRDLYT